MNLYLQIIRYDDHAGFRLRGHGTELGHIITVTTILLLALFLGENLLLFFGISINSFLVSGGILLMPMALSMPQAKIS